MFRSHVEQRPESAGLVKWSSKREHIRKSKIDNCNFQRLWVNQNVFQFDIPVSDFMIVYVSDYFDNSTKYFANNLLTQFSVGEKLL